MFCLSLTFHRVPFIIWRCTDMDGVCGFLVLSNMPGCVAASTLLWGHLCVNVRPTGNLSVHLCCMPAHGPELTSDDYCMHPHTDEQVQACLGFPPVSCIMHAVAHVQCVTNSVLHEPFQCTDTTVVCGPIHKCMDRQTGRQTHGCIPGGTKRVQGMNMQRQGPQEYRSLVNLPLFSEANFLICVQACNSRFDIECLVRHRCWAGAGIFAGMALAALASGE